MGQMTELSITWACSIMDILPTVNTQSTSLIGRLITSTVTCNVTGWFISNTNSINKLISKIQTNNFQDQHPIVLFALKIDQLINQTTICYFLPLAQNVWHFWSINTHHYVCTISSCIKRGVANRKMNTTSLVNILFYWQFQVCKKSILHDFSMLKVCASIKDMIKIERKLGVRDTTLISI